MTDITVWIFALSFGIFVPHVNPAIGNYQINLQGKHTEQSSTYDGGDSSQAVDGNNATALLSGSCTHTMRHPGAWWAVNLGASHTIDSVGLLNRAEAEFRLDHFTIYGYNDNFDPDENPDKVTCYEYDGDFPAGETEYFECNNLVTAQYIGVQSNHPTNEPLSLCEVYIIAVCPDGKYGENCDDMCSENCQSQPCDRFNGGCPGGKCNAGYEGEKCETVCPDGKYGENCEDTCSENCQSQPCDRFTGICPGRKCSAGYEGDKCDRECADGMHGENCPYVCPSNCKISNNCDKKSGDCLNGECKAGFKGDKCETECLLGTYGDRCMFNCSVNCKNQCAATTDNGVCNDGCVAGYKGETCETECVDGMYGENCHNICSSNCKINNTCDKKSGDCLNGECKAGFTGDNCETACLLGTYGDRCMFTCSVNCKNQCAATTDNGVCNGGCVTGYMGETCETECADGMYGENCTNSCSLNCKNSSCDKKAGYCLDGECKPGFKGDKCEAAVIDVTNGPNAGAIAGGILAAVVVIIPAVLVIVILSKRRRKKNSTREDHEDMGVLHSNIASAKLSTLSKPPIANKPTVEKLQSSVKDDPIPDEAQAKPERRAQPAEIVYENLASDESKTKVRLGNIDRYIHSMNALNKPFLEEYEDIPKKTKSWEEADVAELKSKNRYVNILPYDFNRVKLKMVNNDPPSKYINASYIQDYDGQTSYIAALGATDHTVNDIWRMIWETNISSIFMVTKLVEAGKTKCIQYWPNGKTAKYGNIFVSIDDEEDHMHYIKRTMTATMNSDSRTITHYYYTAWPDKQAPTNLSSVLRLRDIIKNLRLQRKIPILIHCSAGIGRTGTLIALDILLDQADKEQAIDVYKCVTKLREQRTQMVQTLGQYIFLYNALRETSTLGRTTVPAKTILSFVKSPDFRNKMTTQFDFLEKNKPMIEAQDLEYGRFDNERKNRDKNIIAADGRRVILLSNPDMYINAVYVPDYRKEQAFCATQLPLRETVADFWRMVLELKSSAVVCLETEPSDNWSFIPQPKTPIVHEDLHVSVGNIEEQEAITISNVEIKTKVESVYANVSQKPVKDDDNHDLKIYELKSWTQKPLPNRDLTLLRFVLNETGNTGEANRKTPLTVVCQNGSTESGLYIAMSIVMDNMKCEQEVDVFQVVKLIRHSRPEFIGSQEQYTSLYQTIAKMAHSKG